MSRSDELCFTPATELAVAIRRRELSSVEVVEAVLDRIDRINPRLNAFVVVRGEAARAEARQADEAIRRGDPAGPLHGVPFTIKDLTSTRDLPTTMGSRAFATHRARENALPLERLLAAGGIWIGKTTTPEFGDKGVTESLLTGTTNNPWRLTHTAGGSSGGAAAAVAAGLGPLAEGSDAGGSIRIPAACCGVVGLKPSFGRVPSYPLAAAFNSIPHQGPITRTVADAALMLTALAGPDDRDPFSIVDSGVDYLAGLADVSIKGARVAFSRDLGLGPVDPRVAAAVERAATVFAETLGAAVTEATPDLPGVEAAMLTIMAVDNGVLTTDAILRRVGPADVDPFLLELTERARHLTAFDYHRAAVGARDRVYRRLTAFFREYDLLIAPTIATPPFPHPADHAPGPAEIAGHPIDPLLGWVRTYPFNLSGHPAISVPGGWTDDGLPIGLQIVGSWHADGLVLRAAAAFEQAAPWADRRPPIQ